MVSLPPEGMASRALTARFMMTCSICPASARTGQRLGLGTMTRSMSSPIMRVSILHVFGGDVVEIDDARGEHLLAAEGQEVGA